MRFVLVAIAATVSLSAFACLAALEFPQSALASYAARGFGLSGVFAARSEADFAVGHWDEAARQSQAALRLSPGLLSEWLRLVEIDLKRHDGILGTEGLAAFQRSYEITPIDSSLGVQRLTLALACWDRLQPSLRASVAQEFQGLWTLLGLRQSLRQLPARIPNPAGQMAARFILGRLDEPR